MADGELAAQGAIDRIRELLFLAHSLASLAATDARVVRAAAWAMNVAAWYVILPLAIASLVTGLIKALSTPWGLFRHYWVTFKLALTATVVLLAKLGPISVLAESASLDCQSACNPDHLSASNSDQGLSP